MTWTVFVHNAGHNETIDDSPGRGGFKYVLVNKPRDEAIQWWNGKYKEDPTRLSSYPEYHTENVWTVEEHEDEDDVRAVCGKKELRAGGIGVPKKRLYEWSELNGRLDVKIVTDE